MRAQAQSKSTTNHDEIRQWVESRGGHPACVRGTGKKGDTGLLRIDYPGYSGKQTLQEISWDEFFEKFDERHLAFLYQDKPDSRFSKLVDADTATTKETAGRKRTAATHRAGSSRSNAEATTSGSRSTKKAAASASKRAAGSAEKRAPAAKKAAAPARKAAPAVKKAAPAKGRTSRSAKTTVDHDEIREWVESRGGNPACVRGTGGKGDPGMLRIDYPGFSGEGKLMPLPWDKWFQSFEANNLAFLYQDTPRSRFSKLVERVEEKPKSRRPAKKRTAPAARKKSTR